MVECLILESEYEYEARTLHNRYRARHYARSLTSRNYLHKRAVRCAQFYVNLGTIDHSCPYVDEAGENIWAQWGGNPSNYRITTRSIKSWYAEESQYRYKGRQGGTGHFTQMVWKNSRELGFGIARAGNMAVAVALYYPAGNYIGQFGTNVRRPPYYRYKT
ncbi:Golgi-associated plant pathogenesis-related protein 1 [Orchesella cincta]|uniref:Golgi-associated plant pathogenesis-related protein 1 n=1 Tax=Orchesella cincta TaxID=48709 RepID=A0A1D2N8G5_ORCCI|nr:Golgi-associated plant pathogenesis-related protein 1 [Orchesella cincta]